MWQVFSSVLNITCVTGQKIMYTEFRMCIHIRGLHLRIICHKSRRWVAKEFTLSSKKWERKFMFENAKGNYLDGAFFVSLFFSSLRSSHFPLILLSLSLGSFPLSPSVFLLKHRSVNYTVEMWQLKVAPPPNRDEWVCSKMTDLNTFLLHGYKRSVFNDTNFLHPRIQ